MYMHTNVHTYTCVPAHTCEILVLSASRQTGTTLWRPSYV